MSEISIIKEVRRMGISKTKVEVWGYAISLFLISMPYFLWNTLFPIVPFVLLFCLFFSYRHVKISHHTIIPIVIFLLLYSMILFRGGYTIFGIATTILILPIFLLDEKFLKDVFEAYVVLFSITIIPSIIVYVLVMFLDFQFPSRVIGSLNLSKSGYYIQYPFLVVYKEWGNIAPRFYGYYDEPGVLGTIAGVVLITRNFNFKDKFNIPIFIAGVLSLSMYFFLTFGVFIIIFSKVKYKIIVILLCSFLVFLFYSNEILYNLIFNRFEIIDGNFVGDNRLGDSSKEWYKSFQKSSNYLLGLGGDSNWRLNYHGASYREIIINYGLIFFIIYVGNFTFLALKKIKISKQFFVYMFILFSVLYQRPFIDNMIYVFILFTPIFVLAKNKS